MYNIRLATLYVSMLILSYIHLPYNKTNNRNIQQIHLLKSK